MAVSAIIFDCDGTILDSMPMWGRIFNEVADKYGVEFTPEVRASFPQKHLASKGMAAFNDYFGLYEDSRDFVTEFYRHVYDEYAAGFPLIDGVEDFVCSVRTARIPYLVATGTRSKEVWAGLRAAGVDDLFMTVLSCEDIQVGKSDPDIYRLATQVLKAPVEETWVFEDEARGLVTARAAGYRTVCIYNGDDPEEEEYLRSISDVFSHAFRDVSLETLQAFKG